MQIELSPDNVGLAEKLLLERQKGLPEYEASTTKLVNGVFARYAMKEIGLLEIGRRLKRKKK